MICETAIHDAWGEVVRICGGTMILRTRDRNDNPSYSFWVCTNPECGTAKKA